MTRPRTKLCPSCQGTGRIEIYRPPFLRPCRTCGGTGKLPDKGTQEAEKAQQNEAQAVKNGQ